MQRIYKALFPTLVMLLLALPASANDCAGAHIVSSNTPSADYTFDGTCDFEGDMPSQRIGVPTNCTGEVWFQWSPGSANTTIYNMDFQVTSPGNCVVNIFLLYSESTDAVDPCYWDLGGLFTPTSWGYTGYQAVSSQALTAGVPFSLNVNGLDGSGTFFIVVEKVSGAGTQVNLAPMVSSTVASAGNDLCTNATPLSVGSGIDPSVLTGPAAGNWINAASASTANSTKQRLQHYCGGAGGATPSTEDHYTNTFLGNCITSGNLGDFGAVPFGVQCVPSIQNTTWYTFTAPVTASDYYIQFGSNAQCSQQPNQIYAMLYGPGFSCNAASAIGSLIDCSSFLIFGAIPGVDHSFDNVSLVAGQTYTIALDGTRGSQCDIEILVSRGNINPILPVTLSYFNGEHVNGRNVLTWETATEEQHDRFDIERSQDGNIFEVIGSQTGQGNSSTPTAYQFEDERTPIGRSFYRLKMVDMNGNTTYSETVELSRIVESFAVLGLIPNPANDFAELILSSPQSVSATITIRDLQGKLLYQEQVERESGEHRIPLNLEPYSSGLYLINVSSVSYSYTGKLIVR